MSDCDFDNYATNNHREYFSQTVLIKDGNECDNEVKDSHKESDSNENRMT